MKGISIVLCTYNGLKSIGKTLEYISNQKIKDFPVELIVVDNNSNDGTYDYVVDFCKKTDFPFPYKILKEIASGKFNASSKGFSNASFDYILICDDDNYLDADYCVKAYEILDKNEKIGLVGGRGIPVFEISKPDWFDKYAIIYACGSQYSKTGLIDDTMFNLWGAGMVFRKKIWEKLSNLKYEFFLNAMRTKKNLSGGDDSELCEIAKWMGYMLYYDENMTFEHFLPAKKLSIDFLKKRYRGFGRSRIYMRAYWHCLRNNELPGINLKIPLWKDILTYRKRQLNKFYPRIWFTKTKPNNFDFILDYQALKGEIAEIKRLKDEYINIYKKIFILKDVLLKNKV